MKKLASLALVTLLTFATSVEADTPAQAKPANPQLSDSTVLAVVGQHSITVDELNQQLNRPDLKATVDALKEQPAELAKLRESVLTSMIDKELLLKAAQSSPSYKPSEVQKALERIKGIKGRALAPGADFGKIAAETSDDTASKIDGGNLGTFQRPGPDTPNRGDDPFNERGQFFGDLTHLKQHLPSTLGYIHSEMLLSPGLRIIATT